MKAALIQSGIRTSKGMLIKKSCAPEQWYAVDMYDTDHGTYSLDVQMQSLADAEREARNRGAAWIFSKLDDAESWLNRETGRE